MRVQDEPEFDFSGGALCLDFANAITGEVAACSDLVAWARQAGAIERRKARALLCEAGAHPRIASRILGRARELRETLFGIFTAIAAGHEPDGADIEEFNSFLGRAAGHLRLELSPEGSSWRWREDAAALDGLLWQVTWSAAELLTSPDIERITECGAANCRWLFLDRSRNRSRRWCDMKTCGNRSKVRRHYRRKRSAASAAGPD